mmetsp:Transcript_111775/g.326841  ORF Transcript_111775/g.326841 Transcript_111775/m.326841 type:complete len:241 (-) Transcript_111775:1221-1943(-)
MDSNQLVGPHHAQACRVRCKFYYSAFNTAFCTIIMARDGDTGNGMVHGVGYDEPVFAGSATCLAHRRLESIYAPGRDPRAVNGAHLCKRGRDSLAVYRECLNLVDAQGLWPCHVDPDKDQSQGDIAELVLVLNPNQRAGPERIEALLVGCKLDGGTIHIVLQTVSPTGNGDRGDVWFVRVGHAKPVLPECAGGLTSRADQSINAPGRHVQASSRTHLSPDSSEFRAVCCKRFDLVNSDRL